jgi:methionine-rich copper-binding protein CopC
MLRTVTVGKVLVGALLAGILAPAAGATAHAFLDHANPLVGSTVRGSPGEVRLWFTEALEPAFSTLRVVDQGGAQVDQGNKAVDPADRTVLKVSLRPLSPGSYKVVWRVLSVDTHTTEGSFSFSVAP